MSQDLGYRLEIVRRSLASTTRPDGGLELAREAVIELVDLLDAAGDAARDLAHLRGRLVELLNNPDHRTLTVPVREVAALLRHAGGSDAEA